MVRVAFFGGSAARRLIRGRVRALEVEAFARLPRHFDSASFDAALVEVGSPNAAVADVRPCPGQRR